MADHFVNGLRLVAPAGSQNGRTFSRWLVEWLTQICGWEVHDAISGNWATYVDQDTGGETVDSEPNQFSIGAYSYVFTSADIGSYLTITGFTGRYASRNGIYRIGRIISDKIVELDVERGMHEDGFPCWPSIISNLTWKLWSPTASYVPTSGDVMVLKGVGTNGAGYDFHLHINVRSSNSYYPEFRMSPFASWNSGTHSWDDSRYTTAKGIDSWNNSLVNNDSCRVWGAADADRFVVMIRMEDDYYSWHCLYAGEIDVKDEVADTNPCVLWAGSNRGNSTVGDDNQTLIGLGADSSLYSGGVWLGDDDLTSLTGYAMFTHVPSSSDVHWLSDSQRHWGEYRRERYRVPIICECRTAGFMELRGTLRRFWTTARDTPRMVTVGTNGEYLHTVGGLLIPWFNSKVWYERG